MKKQSKVSVRVLAGFVDARASFRSYVPGDVVDLPEDKATALASSGHVELVEQAHPASRRETKVTAPKSTKGAA